MEQVKRGKVECLLRYKLVQHQQTEINVNDEYANAIVKACLSISKQLGVVEDPPVNFEPVTLVALEMFDKALGNLLEAKQSEGQRLFKMLEDRHQAMQQIVKKERQRRPQILQQTREKLIKKLEELSASYDKDRFEQELVYIAQKMDVDEELDRLESHFIEIEKILKRNEPVGRRLDFMMQEFNREANTLGSKSTDIETTGTSVELKVLIEQMREQIQNIE